MGHTSLSFPPSPFTPSLISLRYSCWIQTLLFNPSNYKGITEADWDNEIEILSRDLL